ncbi:hypothetical protein [Pedobacter jamesrossensis]|uniref:Bacteriocin-type signal sequence-containing protein n=1 Tax=Pedobacter jamesrossensis TaxID=1908238 RepID=A0ABV8NMU9_9SPHI
MKPKKLEKKTVFLFKKKMIANLSKDQMRKINGGNGKLNPTDHSGTPDCGAQTLNNTFN